jgi:hypothetical protein
VATILPQQPRGPGDLDTGARNVEGAVENNRMYVFTLLMDPADLADATLVLPRITLQSAPAAAGPWRVLAEAAWQGGVTDRHGDPVPPQLSWGQTAGALPTHARMTAEATPRTFDVGIDLSFVPMTAGLGG